MEFLSLKGTFGSLQNESLIFEPGFQLLYLPNEGGKSTWATFLRVMLFGLDKSARDKKDELADKNRYLPFGGGAMEGLLTLRTDEGRIVRLHRFSNQAGPMQGFSATYEDSGEPVPGLTAKNAGRALLGISEETFSASFFVSGGELLTKNSAELEERFQALASTGDASMAYSRIVSRLDRWRLDRKANAKTGRIPEAEVRLKALDNALRAHEALEERAAGIRVALERAKGRTAALQQEYSSQKSAADARHIAKELTRRSIDERLDILDNELPDEEGFEAVSQLKAAYEAALSRRRREEEALPATQRHYQKEINALYEQDKMHAAALAERKRYRVRLFPLVLAVFFVAIAAISFFVPIPIPAISPYEGALFFGLFLLMLLLSLTGLIGRPKDELPPFDFEAEKAALQRRFAEAEAPLERAKGECSQLLVDLSLKLRGLSSIPVDEHSVGSILSALQHKRAEYEELREKRAALDREAPASKDGLTALEAEKQSAVLERERLTRDVSRLEGERKALGSRSELARLREEEGRALALLEREHRALLLAKEEMARANEEMAALVSPEISRMASAYLNVLTLGEWNRASVSKTLDAEVSAPGRLRIQDPLTLSTGTKDQLYLALRLAVIKVLLPGPPVVPIVLDDPFLTFDEERTKAAFALLRSVAKERQILVFSCKKEGAA